jgi:multidrug efflux pump subunit AcrA (membrane-fusion protein)
VHRTIGSLALVLLIAAVSCTPATPVVPRTGGRDVPSAPVPITSALVTQGSIAATLGYAGNVQARSQVAIVPKIAGRVERLYVDTGDEVRQGDAIAELDRAALDAQVAQAEAAVRVMQARLQQVQAGAKPEDIDAAAAVVGAAQARLEQARSGARDEQIAAARAQVGQAQSRLDALLAGPKPDDAIALDAAVDRARATIDQARANVATAQSALTESQYRLQQARAGLGGPNTRSEDIASAQASLNAAQSRLDNLRAGSRPEDIRAAQLAVDRGRVNLAAAQAAVGACGKTVVTTRSEARNDATDERAQATSREKQSCPDSQKKQLEAVRTSAQIALDEAQNGLEKVKNGPTPFDIAQGVEAVRQAEAILQRTRFGGATDLAALELRVGVAQAEAERMQGALDEQVASLEAAQAHADSARNPAEWDVRTAQETINQAQANLALLANPNPYDVRSAQAAVDQARATLESRQHPAPEDVEIAAAQLDQALGALEATRVNQADATLRAPFDGFVAQRLVSAGATVGTSAPIVSLVSRETEIVFQVEESRIGMVARDQSVEIAAAAYPRERFQGTVSTIAPTADPRARTFAVHVRPMDPDGRLWDGMFAQVGLEVPARQATLIPLNAVVNRSGQNIVFVVGPGSRVQSRQVTVGINDGVQVEILPDLTTGQPSLRVGEEVAISALDVLSDGMTVVATRQG